MRFLTTLWICGALLLAATAFASPAPSPAVTIVKEAEVRKIISDFLTNRTNGLDIELNIRKIAYSGDIKLPVGKVEYEVVVPRQWEGWGNGNLALIIRVNGHVVRNVPVLVEVEALTDMLVTTRPLERGEVIAAVDVAVQKRDMTGVGGRICRSAGDVVGKRVRNGLRANMPIRSDAVEKVPLVKSGQMVTILLENDAMRITATGQAKDAGGEGDMVMVRNLNSQKYVPARVVDMNTVKVEF